MEQGHLCADARGPRGAQPNINIDSSLSTGGKKGAGGGIWLTDGGSRDRSPRNSGSGRELLVRYSYAVEDGNREWHARIVLAEVRVAQPDHWWFVILTPDSDIYAEDLGPGSVDVVQTRDRPIAPSIPYGPANVQPPAPLRVQLPIQGDGAALQQVAGGGAPPGRLLPPAPNVPQVAPQGGLAALATALGAGAGPTSANPSASTATSAAPDARVLPVRYDVTGQRYREFAEVVPLIEDIRWPGSPVNCPATFRWVCRFIKEHGGTPTGWRTKWVGICKLQVADAGVALHEAACRMIELLLCYDQCQGGALETGEFAARQIQLTQEKWRDRVLGRNGAEATTDQHLYSGMQTPEVHADDEDHEEAHDQDHEPSRADSQHRPGMDALAAVASAIRAGSAHQIWVAGAGWAVAARGHDEPSRALALARPQQGAPRLACGSAL